jgi:hypothetical protein
MTNLKYFFKKLFQPYRVIKLLQEKNQREVETKFYFRDLYLNSQSDKNQIIADQELELQDLRIRVMKYEEPEKYQDWLYEHWMPRNQNKVRKVTYE